MGGPSDSPLFLAALPYIMFTKYLLQTSVQITARI
jgi:hypothetical protein